MVMRIIFPAMIAFVGWVAWVLGGGRFDERNLEDENAQEQRVAVLVGWLFGGVRER